MSNSISGRSSETQPPGGEAPVTQSANDEQGGTPPSSVSRVPAALNGLRAQAPGLSSANGDVSRPALPVGESNTRRMLIAGVPAAQRVEDAYAWQMNVRMEAAGAALASEARVRPKVPVAAGRAYRPLPIVNARQLRFRPFTHRTADTFAMLAQDDPAFFARATLDADGTLRVQDATREYDATGRQYRVIGLNSPDFIKGALSHFDKDRVKTVAWRWDSHGDSLERFSELLSESDSLTRAVEGTAAGQRLAKAGFNLSHTEIVASHVDESGLVYDAIDLRWSRSDPREVQSDSGDRKEKGLAVDMDLDVMAKLDRAQRVSVFDAAVHALMRRNPDGPQAPLRLDACRPEVAQFIADRSLVPVTVTSTLHEGRAATYLPRLSYLANRGASLDAAAWLMRGRMMRLSSLPAGFVLGSDFELPAEVRTPEEAREWLQSLADLTGAPVARSRDVPFWGDEEIVLPVKKPGGPLDGIPNASRFDDSTLFLPDSLLGNLDLNGEGHFILGTLASLSVLQTLEEEIPKFNRQLMRSSSPRRIERIEFYDPHEKHSRALAQAIADEYQVTVVVAQGSALERHVVFTAGSGGTVRGVRPGPRRLRYEPRTRYRVDGESVRDFAARLQADPAFSSAGIVVHPGSLPESWLDMKEAALQTLADMLNVPVALAWFDERERDLVSVLSGSGSIARAAEEVILYRDEMRFMPQPAVPVRGVAATTPAAPVRGITGEGTLESRDVLQSAGRWVARTIEELETRLSAARGSLLGRLPGIEDATRRVAAANELKVKTRWARVEWQIDSIVREVRLNPPDTAFGPIDDRFKMRVRDWCTNFTERDPSPAFEALMSSVWTKVLSRKDVEYQALKDNAQNAATVAQIGQSELRKRNPEQFAADEKTFLALLDTWEIAQTAANSIDHALEVDALTRSWGAEPSADAYSRALAARADRALTRLHAAMEALGDPPQDDSEA